MESLYVNGLLIITKRFSEIEFIKVDNPSDAILIPDVVHRLLTIKFVDGSTASSISYIDINVIEPNVLLSEGRYDLRPQTTLNGITYHIKGGTDAVNLQQFLIDDQILLTDGVVLLDKCLSVCLQNTSTKLDNIREYLDFINSSEYLYATGEPLGWLYANFYFCPIDGNDYHSHDVSVLGNTKPFDLDSATNIVAVRNAIEAKYPELCLYTSEFKRDTSKDEYLRYEFNLDDIRDSHTPVYANGTLGKFWYTVINGEFEYSTSDYIKCIARRSSYLANEFLVSITNSTFMFKGEEYSNAIFWERNDMVTDSKLRATDSSNDYQLFGFKVRVKVFCPLAQFESKQFPTILYPLVEVINKKFTDK